MCFHSKAQVFIVWAYLSLHSYWISNIEENTSTHMKRGSYWRQMCEKKYETDITNDPISWIFESELINCCNETTGMYKMEWETDKHWTEVEENQTWTWVKCQPLISGTWIMQLVQITNGNTETHLETLDCMEMMWNLRGHMDNVDKYLWNVQNTSFNCMQLPAPIMYRFMTSAVCFRFLELDKYVAGVTIWVGSIGWVMMS